jgi:hypothetical protein
LNIGESKYFPEGPQCKYRGKEVDSRTFTSESGGITGTVLVNVLEYLDALQLFNRYLVEGNPNADCGWLPE